MEEFLKKAVDIVKAQAGVRVMTDEQIISMVRGLSLTLKNVSANDAPSCETSAPEQTPQTDSRKSIKDRSITCLECGKVCKLLSAKHLSTHGLTPEEYREKWGFRKGTPLTCKELTRVRRKKMREMELWKKRAMANKK